VFTSSTRTTKHQCQCPPGWSMWRRQVKEGEATADVVEEVPVSALAVPAVSCVGLVVAETRLGDVELEAADGVLAAGLADACGAVVVDVSAGVEVEETNGGAFSTYVPEGWRA
jgi:hypothetical protein